MRGVADRAGVGTLFPMKHTNTSFRRLDNALKPLLNRVDAYQREALEWAKHDGGVAFHIISAMYPVQLLLEVDGIPLYFREAPPVAPGLSWEIQILEEWPGVDDADVGAILGGVRIAGGPYVSYRSLAECVASVSATVRAQVVSDHAPDPSEFCNTCGMVHRTVDS
jgi:hypothetical protein